MSKAQMAQQSRPPASPTSYFQLTIAGLLLSLSITGLVFMRILPPPIPFPSSPSSFQSAIATAIATSTYDDNGSPVLVPPPTSDAKLKPFTETLKVLVIAFLPGVRGEPDPAFWWLQVYFLSAFWAVIVVGYVEAGRRVNAKGSWIKFPSVYALFYQTVGAAVVLPLYYLGYMRTVSLSRRHGDNYFSPGSTEISPAYASALLPSTILGYLIPTSLMYLPAWDDLTQQRIVALWQFSPFFVGLLLVPLTWLIAQFQPQHQSQSPSGSIAKSADRAALKTTDTVYAVSFLISAVLHVVTVTSCFTSTDPKVSLTSVFDPFVVSTSGSSPLAAGLKYIFQIDFWVVFIASILWAFLAIYELKVERKTDVDLTLTLVYLALGSILLGPAAVLTAVWCWREHRLVKAKLS